MCSVIDAQKNPNQQNTQSPPPEKQHEWFAALTLHQKVRNTRRFSNIRLRHRRPERIFIFGQQTLLDIVRNNSTHVACWWNLQTVPEIFFQLFTIHTSINGYHPPWINALLTNKRGKTWTIADSCQGKIPNSSPTRFLVNFEKAVINAFQKTCTDATLSWCYFHLCQAFVRKINEAGLQPVYEQNHGLAISPNDTRLSLPSTWRNWTRVWSGCRRNYCRKWTFVIVGKCARENGPVGILLSENLFGP